MEIYLAPLQGLTDWIFRESYTQHIGKFDKTFTPFVRVQNGDFYRPSQCNDLLPAHNTFQKPIPQFLGNSANSFKRFEQLCNEHNYQEANINLGCPFPMISGKRMGSGLLKYPVELAKFLEEIFADTKLKISIKCRLGLDSTSEFEHIFPILNQLPLEEIILHPRIGKQQYKGEVNMDAFAHFAHKLKHPVCFNGDILTVSDVERLKTIAPQIKKIMIGRGILQNPFLLASLKNQELTKDQKALMLRNFHLSILDSCKQKYSGDLHLLKRLEEMWEYQSKGFEDGHKIYKQVKKSKTIAQYETVVFAAISNI